MKSDDTTSLVIDLSDLDNKIHANMKSFPITFYRSNDNTHTISIERKNISSLLSYLTLNNISFKETVRGDTTLSFVEIFVKSDVFLAPNHHIELRVRERAILN
jgi:hypothetical protein